MSGLFGGNKNDTPATPPVTTLPAPALKSPEASTNQAKAQAEALQKAQASSTLATDTSTKTDDGTYNRTTLG